MPAFIPVSTYLRQSFLHPVSFGTILPARSENEQAIARPGLHVHRHDAAASCTATEWLALCDLISHTESDNAILLPCGHDLTRIGLSSTLMSARLCILGLPCTSYRTYTAYLSLKISSSITLVVLLHELQSTLARWGYLPTLAGRAFAGFTKSIGTTFSNPHPIMTVKVAVATASTTKMTTATPIATGNLAVGTIMVVTRMKERQW